MLAPRVALRILLLCLLPRCATARVVKLEPKEPITLTSVFVYPFGFRWEEPAWRSNAMAQRLLSVALAQAGDSLAFYGPEEFRVLKPDVEAAWVATTALQVLLQAGGRAEQGVMLKAWAEKREERSVAEAADAKGKSTGAAGSASTTFIGHVELTHPSQAVTLFEIEDSVKVDPFTPVADGEDEYDAAPALTHLMERLVRAAVKHAARSAAVRPVGPELPWTLAIVPREAFRGSADRALTQDPIEAALAEERCARFLNPWLPPSELPRLLKAPAGSVVVGAPAGSRVVAGDTIVSLEGGPALPHHLWRLRFLAERRAATVRHADGATEELYLP